MKCLVLILLSLAILGCETQKVEEVRRNPIPQVTENSDQSYILIGDHAFNQSMITDIWIGSLDYYHVKLLLIDRSFAITVYDGTKEDCRVLLEEIIEVLAKQEL